MTNNYYNLHAEQYFNETILLPMDDVIARFLQRIPEDAKILDLGCGSGRDSLYFIEKGFSVTAIDGSEALAKRASQLIGQDVLVQDFRALSLPSEFDGIWACASLLHLPKKDMLPVLHYLKAHLSPNGIFFASFKAKSNAKAKAKSEEIMFADEGVDSRGRFFAYYEMDELIAVFQQAGFQVVEQWQECKPLRESMQSWLNVIVTHAN
uniref:class I SAM-dependent methyltransferase n=1 Tax=Ningiella ruwaisensis TaxID=2364274 RepID=UPI0010A04CE6|nr:class I SAM-dependent methyltransferase [Ningiella ruwaisensis]